MRRNKSATEPHACDWKPNNILSTSSSILLRSGGCDSEPGPWEESLLILIVFLSSVFVEHGIAAGILSVRHGSRPRGPISQECSVRRGCAMEQWGTAIRTCTAQGGGRAKGSLPSNLIGCPPRHPRGTSAPCLYGAWRQNALQVRKAPSCLCSPGLGEERTAATGGRAWRACLGSIFLVNKRARRLGMS